MSPAQPGLAQGDAASTPGHANEARGPGPDARLLDLSPLRLRCFPHQGSGHAMANHSRDGERRGRFPSCQPRRPAEAARRGADVLKDCVPALLAGWLVVQIVPWPCGRSVEAWGKAFRQGAELSAVEQSARPWGSSPLWGRAFYRRAELFTGA